MRFFFRLILFFGIFRMVSQAAMAQKAIENFDLIPKNQKIIIQRNPADYLVFLNRSDTLSQRNIRELNKENNYYIPTKKLQKDFGFKTPTYHPSYNLNYQLRIKTIPPGLFKPVKSGSRKNRN